MKWWRAIAILLLIIVAESINGTIRRIWIVPALDELRSHQLGVLTASALILFIAWLTARWLDARTFKAQLQIGVLWVVLMLCFEFGVGLAIGNSMQQMLAEYDLSRGRLMGLGFLVLLFAPALGARITNLHERPLGNGHAD
jgi:hypothetical protein